MYLNKQCRRPAENQKVLSSSTLDILLSQEFPSVQSANLRQLQHLRRNSLGQEAIVENR